MSILTRRKDEKQTRYLSQAIQLEEAVNPHIIRITMLMVSLAIICFLIWAGMTNINEVARAPGEVVPRGYQQTVQHLEGGIINTIAIQEGDIVKKDQILLTLDDSILQSDLTRANSRQNTLAMQEERLRAYMEQRKPDFSAYTDKQIIEDQEIFFEGMSDARTKEAQIIEDQIKQKQQSIQTLETELQTEKNNYAIVKSLYDRRAELNKHGYAPTIRLLENERQLNEVSGKIKRIDNQILVAKNEIDEFKARLSSLSAQYMDETHEKLDAILAEKAQNAETIDKLNERIARLNLRSPAHGMVKGLAVNTVGAVIQPAQVLMEIVPMDTALEVAVKIPPQHIGHIKPGQPVHLKFSTFDFSRYGSVQGELKRLSATTFNGENGERYYHGTITLKKNYVGNNPANTVIPGMTVMADIITGKKTILEYLLKPIHISLKTAFTER